MKRRPTIFLTILALLLAIPLVWTMWPEGPLDLSKDEEPFRSMVLPPQSVIGDIIVDGGRVVMTVIDQAGTQHGFHFWIEKENVINSHPTAGYETKIGGKSILLKDPARAKIIAIRLLRDYGLNRDGGITRALYALSDPAGEMAYRVYEKARNQFHEWTGF